MFNVLKWSSNYIQHQSAIYQSVQLEIIKLLPNPTDWGDKDDSDIVLPMVNVLESTLEWT
jgi:hypothetical protein